MSTGNDATGVQSDENGFTPGRKAEDLGLAEGVFYRMLRLEEVPFWLREDAQRHMALLSAMLMTPPEAVEWFVPTLYDEVPEAFVEHVASILSATRDTPREVIWSDAECSPRITDPVYVWRDCEVLGFTYPDSAYRGIFLRADMPRTGIDGVDFDIAHEMKHRQQAHQRAMDGETWSDGNECERDADEFAFLYMQSVVVGQENALILSPELNEALIAGSEVVEIAVEGAEEEIDLSDIEWLEGSEGYSA